MKQTIQQTDERVRERMRHDKVVADAMGVLRHLASLLEHFTACYPADEGKDAEKDNVMMRDLETMMYTALQVLDELREEEMNGDHR
jgi:hypothetical protein